MELRVDGADSVTAAEVTLTQSSSPFPVTTAPSAASPTSRSTGPPTQSPAPRSRTRRIHPHGPCAGRENPPAITHRGSCPPRSQTPVAGRRRRLPPSKADRVPQPSRGGRIPAQDGVQKETGDTQRLTDISPPLPHPSCHKKYTVCSFGAIHEDVEASTMGFMSYRV